VTHPRAHAALCAPPTGRAFDEGENASDAVGRWLSGGAGRPGFPGPREWLAVADALLPGAHVAAFAGGAESDLVATAARMAGLEVRDTLRVLPFGCCILLARKPLEGTVAANAMAHGTGGLNIDACRVGAETIRTSGARPGRHSFAGSPDASGSHKWNGQPPSEHAGRWPANVVHDGSEAALARFAQFGEKRAGVAVQRHGGGQRIGGGESGIYHGSAGLSRPDAGYGGGGSAARFFPSLAPGEVLGWLCRLIAPPGGLVLCPFPGLMGAREAAEALGCTFRGVEWLGREGWGWTA
jgi:site-specific DNA-methyltransferase (adenine-specific)